MNTTMSMGEQDSLNRGIFNQGNRGELFEHMENYEFDVKFEEVLTSSGIKVPDRKAIIRTDTNTVVGEVGKYYKILTHKDALNPIIDEFNSRKIKTFQRMALVDNGARMYANIYFPDWQIELKTPSGFDSFWPGITVTNSFDGILKYRIRGSIFRLICTNGMVIPVATIENISTTHSKNKDFRTMVDQIAYSFSDGMKFETLQKWSNSVLTPEAMAALAEKIVKSKQSIFPNRYLSLVNDEIAREVSNGVTTVWGLYNAFNSVLEHHFVRKNGKFERARMLDENLFRVFESNFS